MTASRESPYKFLDAYTLSDRKRFFGRGPEINILVADIVTARLVVLFAKTGTGKTSLINAGARPVLHDRGYETFFVRVEKDPIGSALKTIGETHPVIREQGPFAEQLTGLAQTLARPIVIFFDQFEEFFLFVVNDEPGLAKQFVDAISDIYDNDESGVHVVFSMREEFFVELELFRDGIPTIYHADSNLRLKHLEPAQARSAIVEPARAAGVEIDPEVVDGIIRDLSRTGPGGGGGLIEPAQLQIVCDELWSSTVNDRIELPDYQRLGHGVAHGSVAQAILYERIRREMETIENREELKLAERLLPLLRTDRHTKWIRDLSGLVQVLNVGEGQTVDEDQLRNLMDRLARAGVIHVVLHGRMEAAELTHDYLVEHLDAIVAQIRAIWPQRMLDRALARYSARGELATPEELDDIVAGLPDLDLDQRASEAANLMFLSGVAHGQHGLFLFDFAERQGLDPVGLFRRLLELAAPSETERAVTLLIELMEKLPRVRARGFDVLREMLYDPGKTIEAQRALGGLASTARIEAPEVSDMATAILLEFLQETIATGQVTPGALSILGETATYESVELLQQALQKEDLRMQAQDALLRLVAAEEVHEAAADVLLAFVHEQLPTNGVISNAIRQLGLIQRTEAVDVLTEALSYTSLRSAAELALKQLEESDSDVALAAHHALTGSAAIQPREVSPAPTSVFRRPASPRDHSNDWSASELALIADLVQRQRCVLFLGPGIHAAAPSGAPYQYSADQAPPVGSALSRHLAQTAGLLETFPLEDPGNLSRVAMFYEETRGRRRLVDAIAAVQVNKRPSPLLQALAQLNFPVVVTTNYDRLFEQALMAIGKEPLVSAYSPDPKPTDFFRETSPQRPGILKLHGDIEQPESIVITDEDYIQFALRMGDREPYDPVPLILKYYMTEWSSLFLGYSLFDYNNRLLFEALRRKIDVKLSDMYVVDWRPDPLLVSSWQDRRRFVRFIGQDLWAFIFGLYESVLGREYEA
jgi:hypothetical protein